MIKKSYVEFASTLGTLSLPEGTSQNYKASAGMPNSVICSTDFKCGNLNCTSSPPQRAWTVHLQSPKKKVAKIRSTHSYLTIHAQPLVNRDSTCSRSRMVKTLKPENRQRRVMCYLLQELQELAASA